MVDQFNYNILLNQALQKVRNIRDPRSIRQAYVHYGLGKIHDDHVASIGGPDYRIYTETVQAAHNITVDCLKATLFYLFKHYKYEFNLVEEKHVPPGYCFAFYESKASSLLLFKEPSNDFLIVSPDYFVDELNKHKMAFGAKECRVVYLLYENARQQFLNQEVLPAVMDNSVVALQALFEFFFSAEEFTVFRRCFTNFTRVVNEYLGFSVVKNLTPMAQANFAKIVQHRLVNFDYKKLLSIKMHEKILFEDLYKNIRQQYFDSNLYLIMLGNHDFAESLITAEWMYDSMKEAKAIDLTVIGMGYLKAIEQLLYSIVLLHRNEGRTIKSNIKDGPQYVLLDDANIAAESIDSTIGALANFCAYKQNQDIFRSNLPFKAKKYVTESIFVFKDIRNGYFHKHNIRDWAKIDEIRDFTYYLAFLLLGAAELTETTKKELGFPQGDFTSDKYRLCEYINHHAKDYFILCYGEGQEAIVQACRDENARPVGRLFMNYSGAFFSQFGGAARDVFTDMPKEIYLARIEVTDGRGLQFTPHKTKKIYENGKFVGPSIFDEVGQKY